MDVVDNVVVPTAERNAGRALEPKHMSLVTWSWFFLLIYIGLMLTIRVLAQRHVKHADDFAAARGSYEPLFLARFYRCILEAEGLTQEELAERLHTNKSNISRLENVNSPVSPTPSA